MKNAWERLKTWPAPTLMGVFVGMGTTFVLMFVFYIVMFLGIAVFGGVGAAVTSAAGGDDDTAGLVMTVAMVGVSLIVYPLFFAGIMLGQIIMFRGALATARGENMEFGALVAGLPRKALRAAGLSLLLILAIFPGLILLYVPGIYLALRWSLSIHYLLDTDLGVIDCMKASWRATEDRVLEIFLRHLVLGLIAIPVILFTCYMGSLVMVPVQLVFQSMLYMQLSGRMRSALPDPELATY